MTIIAWILGIFILWVIVAHLGLRIGRWIGRVESECYCSKHGWPCKSEHGGECEADK